MRTRKVNNSYVTPVGFYTRSKYMSDVINTFKVVVSCLGLCPVHQPVKDGPGVGIKTTATLSQSSSSGGSCRPHSMVTIVTILS